MWYNKYMENEVKNSANASEDLVALRSENEKLKAENREKPKKSLLSLPDILAVKRKNIH